MPGARDFCRWAERAGTVQLGGSGGFIHARNYLICGWSIKKTGPDSFQWCQVKEQEAEVEIEENQFKYKDFCIIILASMVKH